MALALSLGDALAGLTPGVAEHDEHAREQGSNRKHEDARLGFGRAGKKTLGRAGGRGHGHQSGREADGDDARAFDHTAEETETALPGGMVAVGRMRIVLRLKDTVLIWRKAMGHGSALSGAALRHVMRCDARF